MSQYMYATTGEIVPNKFGVSGISKIEKFTGTITVPSPGPIAVPAPAQTPVPLTNEYTVINDAFLAPGNNGEYSLWVPEGPQSPGLSGCTDLCKKYDDCLGATTNSSGNCFLSKNLNWVINCPGCGWTSVVKRGSKIKYN